jgi:hypothetical protein
MVDPATAGSRATIPRPVVPTDANPVSQVQTPEWQEARMKLVQAKCPRCGCLLFAEPDDIMPYCETCIEIVVREQTEHVTAEASPLPICRHCGEPESEHGGRGMRDETSCREFHFEAGPPPGTRGMTAAVPLRVETDASGVVTRCWLPDGTEVFEGDEIYVVVADGSVHVRRKMKHE